MEALFVHLEAEHRRIHDVSEALDRFAASLRHDRPLDLHDLIRFVTFFRGFAEGLHHEREETVLLPCLALAGFSLDAGPLAHIRDQHQEEARLLLGLEMAASAIAPWSQKEIARVAAAAHAFTAFERAHMAKERDLLFPMAEKELVPARVGDLEKAAARFERRAQRWDQAWLEQLGVELVATHPARAA